MAGESLPDHVRANRESWDQYAPEMVERGRRDWAGEPHWGIWHVPETELRLVPEEGRDLPVSLRRDRGDRVPVLVLELEDVVAELSPQARFDLRRW